MAGLGMLARIGLPVAGSLFQSWQAHRANKANRADQQEALGVLDTEGGALQNQYSDLVQQQLNTNQDILYGSDVPKGMQPNPMQLQGYRGLYDATMAQAQGYAKDLTNQYANRLTSGLGMLEGLGDSARNELNRQYQALNSTVDAGLRDRGFSGSMLASGALNVQGQKDRSTAALNEQLQAQKLGVFSNLSGDYLNALGQSQSNLINLGSGLGREFINAQVGAQGQANAAQLSALGYADANLGRRLGLITGYPVQGPPPGNPFDAAAAGFANQNAYQMQREAATAGKNDWLAPTLVGGGLNLATAGVYGTAAGAW